MGIDMPLERATCQEMSRLLRNGRAKQRLVEACTLANLAGPHLPCSHALCVCQARPHCEPLQVAWRWHVCPNLKSTPLRV